MALRSQSSPLITLGGALLALLFGCLSVSAQDEGAPPEQYLAAIELHTAQELQEVLGRAEALLLEGVLSQEEASRVTFVLHGPEVRILLRQNYPDNREVVDLAARLSALGVVDIKACLTWMGGNSIRENELQPFVGTVPYGVAEVDRLVKEQGYLYF